MLAVAFSRRTRAVIGVLAVAVWVGAVVPVVVGKGWASSGRDGVAARLIRLDPGARLGANTQVATAVGARLAGVRGRVNFIIGLAPRQRIVGGAGHDRLEGGPGHNRIVDRQGRTVVVAGPGRNHIDVADGSGDRVLCAAGSINRIVVDRGDRLHPRCASRAASTVLYRRPPSSAPPAKAPVAHAAQAVS